MNNSLNFQVIADLQKLKESKISKDTFLQRYSVDILRETVSFLKKNQTKYFDNSSEIFLITKVLELQTLISETPEWQKEYLENLSDYVN